MLAKQFLPRLADKAWTKPSVVVLLPSPNGVGVMLFVEERRLYGVLVIIMMIA